MAMYGRPIKSIMLNEDELKGEEGERKTKFSLLYGTFLP
jgi:hypothetical protein